MNNIAAPDKIMTPLWISHYTVVTALGRGLDATYAALRARRSGLKPCNFEDADLSTYIGRVEGLEDYPITGSELMRFDCRNNRLALLGLRQDGFEEAARAAARRHGAGRIAVILGTSTSGINETEHAYRDWDQASGVLPASFLTRYRHTHNTFSLAHFVRAYLGLRGPAAVISTACSSSAKVFASAARFLASGVCDAAIVGGVDSLCLTTLYGFSALGLSSTRPCRPWDEARDGLSLGEAAGFAILERVGPTTDPGGVALYGYGESCDGYHMSHPHPEGLGAILAMRSALARAGIKPEAIDYINLHGTATPTNDRVEDLAINSVFGATTPCSSTKGWTGHTLGAAGITEAVIVLLCLAHGFVPATLNTARPDPALASRVLIENQERPLGRVLSNIFGFGGNNCSLIFGRL